MDKFTPADLQQAVEDLSMCDFFPREPGAQAAIMRLLAKIVPHRQALRWLVGEFTNKIGKWHGPAELRAVLCTRYQPQDGIEGWSQLSGYSASDAEERAINQHKQLKADGTIPEIPEARRLIASAKGMK